MLFDTRGRLFSTTEGEVKLSILMLLVGGGVFAQVKLSLLHIYINKLYFVSFLSKQSRILRDLFEVF